MTGLISIVIPVYNEGEALVPYLDEVIAQMGEPCRDPRRALSMAERHDRARPHTV